MLFNNLKPIILKQSEKKFEIVTALSAGFYNLLNRNEISELYLQGNLNFEQIKTLEFQRYTQDENLITQIILEFYENIKFINGEIVIEVNSKYIFALKSIMLEILKNQLDANTELLDLRFYNFTNRNLAELIISSSRNLHVSIIKSIFETVYNTN